MADDRCHKQYFTYVERGDKNCGCNSESLMEIRVLSDGDIYEILNLGTHTQHACCCLLLLPAPLDLYVYLTPTYLQPLLCVTKSHWVL